MNNYSINSYGIEFIINNTQNIDWMILILNSVVIFIASILIIYRKEYTITD